MKILILLDFGSNGQIQQSRSAVQVLRDIKARSPFVTTMPSRFWVVGETPSDRCC